MIYIKKDVLIGGLLATFAILLYLVIIPAQVRCSGQGPRALSPQLFCHITAGLLLLLSLNLVITGLRDKETKSVQRTSKNQIFRGTVAVVISTIYVLLIPYLGYFAATLLFMIIFLLGFGAKDWKGMVVFLVVILPFIYLLFVKALKVILPAGIMF